MEAIEAIETCKAIRRFTKEPVPDELVLRVLSAANCAPSPGNTQGWQFVVIRERAVKQRLSDAFSPMLRGRWTEDDLRDGAPNARMYRGVLDLAQNLAEVPVLVAVVGLPQFPDKEHDPERLLVCSLYGVTQNLLVAARSLGLGTTLTMFHEIDEDLVKECLRIPSAVRIASLVPMGWPAERFVHVKRHPLETLVHWEQW